MNLFIEATKKPIHDWNVAFSAVQSDEVFNFATMKSDAGYSRQIALLDEYRTETKNYQDMDFMGMMKQYLEPLGDSELVKKAMEGAQLKYKQQSTILKPLLATHIRYADIMQQIITMLHENPEEWSFRNDELSFSNDKLERRYDAMITVLIQEEDKINTLSEKLIEGM